MRQSGKPVLAQASLAALLALIAGYVDAFAFFNYQVFSSFMSGNTTLTGLLAGQGHLAAAGYNLLPVPLFIMGVFAGTLIMESNLNRRLRWLFAAVACLLGAGIAAAALGPLPGWVSIVILSLAMGIMNTAVANVGLQSVSPGYVSGTLNNLAQHLAFAAKGTPLGKQVDTGDSHLKRAVLLAGIWTAFVTGALLAGLATPRLAVWSLVFPFLGLAVLAAVDAGSGEAGQGLDR